MEISRARCGNAFNVACHPQVDGQTFKSMISLSLVSRSFFTASSCDGAFSSDPFFSECSAAGSSGLDCCAAASEYHLCLEESKGCIRYGLGGEKAPRKAEDCADDRGAEQIALELRNNVL